tara:strand:- start:15231 stop:15518 length:288 start_codon:yes stop_codon:yes gene_type:complete
MEEIRLYTNKDLARMFGVQVLTVYQWRARGIVRPRRKRRSIKGKQSLSWYTDYDIQKIIDHFMPVKAVVDGHSSIKIQKGKGKVKKGGKSVREEE